MPVESIYKGLLEEFVIYIKYTRLLAFYNKPDYCYLRYCFCRLFKSRGFVYNNVYNWTEKRFYKIQRQIAGVLESNPLWGLVYVHGGLMPMGAAVDTAGIVGSVIDDAAL